MAKWYEELNYGVYNSTLINRAEYLMLRKTGVLFIVEE